MDVLAHYASAELHIKNSRFGEYRVAYNCNNYMVRKKLLRVIDTR